VVDGLRDAVEFLEVPLWRKTGELLSLSREVHTKSL